MQHMVQKKHMKTGWIRWTMVFDNNGLIHRSFMHQFSRNFMLILTLFFVIGNPEFISNDRLFPTIRIKRIMLQVNCERQCNRKISCK